MRVIIDSIGRRRLVGTNFHEDIVEFCVTVISLEKKPMKSSVLYRRYVKGRPNYVRHNIFQGHLSDETLKVEGRRLTRVSHGVYTVTQAGEEKKFDVRITDTVDHRTSEVKSRIKKFLEKNSVSSTQDLLGTLEETPRIEMDAGEVYRIIKTLVGAHEIERLARGIYGREGASHELDQIPKTARMGRRTRMKKARFYTADELIAYAKENGLSETDIAESVEFRRVGITHPGYLDEF